MDHTRTITVTQHDFNEPVKTLGYITYEASAEWLQNDAIQKELIETFRERLPLIVEDLGIETGSTDYIYLKTPIPAETEGWLMDKYNRMVVIFDGFLIFQRYTNEHLMMITKLTPGCLDVNFKQLSNDGITDFIKKLK